jgi:pilus assembly protein Flp/PilA
MFERAIILWSTARRSEIKVRSRNMKNIFARFVKDESGATAIEYGLIASLIGVAIIAGVRALGTGLSATFASVSGNLA